MPDKLNPFEQLYWHGMCFIFHNYKNGVINKKKLYEYRESLRTEIDELEKEVLQRGHDQSGG